MEVHFGFRGIVPPQCSGIRTAATTLAMLALAGCTIFNPVPRSDVDRRFPRGKPVELTDVNAGKLPDAYCDGQSCVDPPDQARAYYGTLGVALWQADQERLAMIRDGLERTQLNSTFNALTWPAVAWAVTKKLRHPGWSVRDAVAIGFAAHKVLGEGIPERDRIYLQSANRLACTMMAAEAFLYLTPGRSGQESEFDLVNLVPALDTEIDAHELMRADMVTELVLKPVSVLKPRDALHASRRQALGLSNTGGTSDPVAPMLATFGQTFKASNVTLGEGKVVLDQVGAAGGALMRQLGKIKGAMRAELQGRAPAAINPLTAAGEFMDVVNKEVAKRMDAASAAGAAKAQSRNASAVEAPWEPTPERLKGLTAPAADRVKQFWSQNEVPLRVARRKTQAWLTLHQRRVAGFKAEAGQLGCGAKDFNDFIAELANRPVASPVNGAGTGTVAGTGTAPGNTPGETPIPVPGGSP